MEDLTSSCPMRYFSLLPDSRAGNISHPLSNIILFALAAQLCGADGWEEIAAFAASKAAWFATFMDLTHGTPSADTFRRVISSLNPEAFEQRFMQWMAAVVELSQGRLIAVDGKSIRRSFEQGWDKSGMAHMVSAFASHNGQVLAQLKTDGKGNELEGIRQLLGLIDLNGATVTIDALGCQKDIAQQIIEAEGDYILAVKENQKTLYQAITREMDDMIRNQFKGVWHDRHKGTDTGHGRIETRQVWVTDEIGWLKQAADWAGLKSVIVVESDREVIGKGHSVERRYFITSHDADAEALGQGIRHHWGIENGLHHVLDVSFREDDSRVRRGHGAENLSRLRRIAMNRFKQVKCPRKRASMKSRRKIAGWDHQFLLNLLTT